MKRFSLIFLGVLAMLFVAGCSKSNPQPSDPDAWVTDLSLPVPIQFGSTSILETKAGYESLNDFSSTTFGVFGLAGGGSDSDALLFNEPATLSNGYLALSGGTKYYPKDSDKNYTFYAYAPMAATGGLSPVISLGTQDYVWDSAEATPLNNADGVLVNGYNARYMRTIRQMGVVSSHSPNFDFKHVTSGLKILAVANVSGQDTSSDSDFENIKITNVTLRNVYKSGTLDVMTGNVTDLKNPGAIALLAGGNVNPTKAGTPLGEAFPYMEDGSPINLEVLVDSPLGNHTITIPINSMEPGIKYVYKILFNKPDDVKIAVSGVAWSEEQEMNFDDNGDVIE